jgi:hypothetical protein
MKKVMVNPMMTMIAMGIVYDRSRVANASGKFTLPL